MVDTVSDATKFENENVIDTHQIRQTSNAPLVRVPPYATPEIMWPLLH